MKKLLSYQEVLLGCDPEFFFKTPGGVIIGSERILPENGLHDPEGKCIIVRDGIQAELNPAPSTCRQNLATNIRIGLKTLRDRMKRDYPERYRLDFSGLVEVSKEELSALSEKSKTFGCSESLNAQKQLKKLDKISKIDVNPAVYLKRSAGGHLHFGWPTNSPHRNYDIVKNPEIIVPLMDIIVGNTCVMLDTDPANAERRKVYGRAGEYRLPKHGLEYRTLSNFWLRHPALMSLVTGLARTAIEIALNSTEELPYYKQLFKLVDMDDIEKAINNNNVELAEKNWNKIAGFLMDVIPTSTSGAGWFPVDANNIKQFTYFVDKGLDHWFKLDPLEVWTGMTEENEREGFNGWMWRVVAPQVSNPVRRIIKSVF